MRSVSSEYIRTGNWKHNQGKSYCASLMEKINVKGMSVDYADELVTVYYYPENDCYVFASSWSNKDKKCVRICSHVYGLVKNYAVDFLDTEQDYSERDQFVYNFVFSFCYDIMGFRYSENINFFQITMN